jgi:hypothetical protein
MTVEENAYLFQRHDCRCRAKYHGRFEFRMIGRYVCKNGMIGNRKQYRGIFLVNSRNSRVKGELRGSEWALNV